MAHLAHLLATILLLLGGLSQPPVSQPVASEVHMASLMDILRSVGFSGEGLRIAYAVAMAESSGNAKAFNGNRNTGDQSYGLFQINMLGDMGPERRRQYGLSSNDDLYDPYVNARVAYKMSNGGRNWKPWSTYKRGDYKQFLGGADVTVSATSSGSGGGGGGGGAPLARNEAAEQYGFVEGMLDAIPELRAIFNKAVSGGWTPSKFQAEVRNTKWFKSTSESERQFLIKQYGDPATVGQMWNTNQIKVRQMAGLTGASIDWSTINKMAYGVMALGWTDEKLRMELARHIQIGKDDVGGEAGKVIAELREYGYQMGYTPALDKLGWAAMAIVGGEQSIQDYKSHIRSVSKGIYSQWADQIDGGQTVMQLASPYFQSMSTILELPPGSITLDDPTIKRTLQAKDPQTGANRIKQLWEFENELRSDDRWKRTQNAQNSTMQVAHQVLADFGFKS